MKRIAIFSDVHYTREIRRKSIPTFQGNYDEGVGHDRESCGCAYVTEEEKESGAISLEWTQKKDN